MTDGELFTFLSQYADLPQAPDNVVGTTTEGPCVKCDWRFDPQMYEGSGMLFSKVVAEAFTRDQTPRVIPERLMKHYAYANGFSEEHVAHVRDVDSPGIAVMGFNDQQQIFTILLDGTHRMMSALRRGREFRAFVLNPRDTSIIATITTELSNTNFFWVDPSLRVHPIKESFMKTQQPDKETRVKAALLRKKIEAETKIAILKDRRRP